MAEEPGGGGGGQEIFSLFGSVGVDIGGVLQDLAALESATQGTARTQQQYLASINRAWEDAGKAGNRTAQAYLATARSAMQAGQSFSQALQSLKAMQTPREAIQGLQQFKAAIDSVAQSNKALERASNPKAIAEYTQELQRAAREAGRRVQLPGGQIVTITDQNRVAIERLAREQAVATETAEAATRQWNNLVETQKREITVARELAEIERRSNDPEGIQKRTRAIQEQIAAKERFLRTQSVPGGESWIHEEGDDATDLAEKFGNLARAQARLVDGNTAAQRSYNALVAAERAVIAEEERMAQMRARAVTAQQNTLRQEDRIAEIRANMQRQRPQAQPGPQFERDSPIDAARQNFYSARNAWMQTGRPGPELARFNQAFQAVNQARWGNAAPFPGEGRFNQSDVARRAAALRAQATPQFERDFSPRLTAADLSGSGRALREMAAADPAMRATLRGYGSGGATWGNAEQLNRVLRGAANGQMIFRHERGARDLIDTAMRQTPGLARPATAFRGVPLRDILPEGIDPRELVGHVIRNAGYSSFTTNPQIAHDFSRRLIGYPGAVIGARFPAGQRGLPLTAAGLGFGTRDEQEFLAPRGTDLRITGARQFGPGATYLSAVPHFEREITAAQRAQAQALYDRIRTTIGVGHPGRLGTTYDQALAASARGRVGTGDISAALRALGPEFQPSFRKPGIAQFERDTPADVGLTPGAGERLMFHGGASHIPSVDPAKLGEENLVGRGFYLTTDPRVAGGVVARGGEQPPWTRPAPGPGGVPVRRPPAQVLRQPGDIISRGYAQQRQPDYAYLQERQDDAREQLASAIEERDRVAARVAANPAPAGGWPSDDVIMPAEHNARYDILHGLPGAQHWVDQYQQTIDEAHHALRSGPNVTPFRVPTDLNLVHLDQPLPPYAARHMATRAYPRVTEAPHEIWNTADQERLATSESRAKAEEFIQEMVGSGSAGAGQFIPRLVPGGLERAQAAQRQKRLALYQQLRGKYSGGSRPARHWHEAFVNAGTQLDPVDVLSEAGVQGIEYHGGSRVPLQDEAGQAIRHDALSVFPQAVHRLTPYFRANAPQFERDTPAHVRLSAGAGEQLMFHGSASDVRGVDPARLGVDNLAGRGFYLTSDPRVAGGIVQPREHDEPLIREQGYAQRRAPEWEDSANARRYAEEFERSLAEGPTHTGTYWVKDWRQTEARQRAGGVDEEGNFWPEEHTRAMAAHWRGKADEAAALEHTGPNVTPFRVPANLRTISLDDQIQPGLALRLANLVHPHPPAFVPGQHDVVDISGKRVHTAASKEEAAEHLAAMHASGINRDFYRIKPVGPEHLAGRRSEALSRRRRLVETLTNANRYDKDTGWFRLLEEAAAPTREPHELLSGVGIEGIRYRGGVRMPLVDEAGAGIEHEALAVLPGAARRVSPYFRGNAPQFEREFGVPRGPTPGEAVAAAALARLTPGFRAGQLPKAEQLRYLGMAENPPAVAAFGRRTGPLDVADPTVTAALRRLHPDDLQFIRGIRPYGAGEREGYERAAAALGAGGGAARAQTLAGEILYRPDILGDPNRAASTFAHETGHTIFDALPEQMQQRYAQQFRPDAGQRGMEGATTFAEHLRRGGEVPPTNYAFSSIGEDFAESFRVHRGFTRDWERGENVQLGAGRRGFMGDVDTWLRGQGGAQFETEPNRRARLRGALPTGGQSGLAGLIRTAVPFAQWAAVNNAVARRDVPNQPPLTREEVAARVTQFGGQPTGGQAPLTAEEVRGRVEAAGGRPTELDSIKNNYVSTLPRPSNLPPVPTLLPDRPSNLPPIPAARQFGYEDLPPDLQRDVVAELGQRRTAMSRTRAFGRTIPNRNQFVQGLTGLTPGTPEHAQLFQAAQGAGALRTNVAIALLNQRARFGTLAPYGPPVTPPVNGFAAQITPAVPTPAAPVVPAPAPAPAPPAPPVITPAGAVRTITTPTGPRYLLTPAAGGSPTFIGAGAAAAMGVVAGAAAAPAAPVAATPVPPAAGPVGPVIPNYARYWGAITGAVGGAGAAAAGAVGGVWGAAFGAGAGGGPGGGRPPTPPPAPPPAGAGGGPGAPFYPYANTPGRGPEWATTRGEADILEREAALQGELNGLLAVSEAHYRRIYDAAHRVVTEQERSLQITQRSTAGGIQAARTQAATRETRDANRVTVGGEEFDVTNPQRRREVLAHAAATNRAARQRSQLQEQFDEAGGGRSAGGGGGSGGGTFGGIGRLSPANMLRIGAGVFGIPLGINIFAGIARDLHSAIQTAIDDQIKWQQQVRATAAVYGSQLTPAIETSAIALSQSPAFKGTAAQFLQAQTEARGVLGARAVGFSAENQTQVVQLAGAFARLHPEVGDAQKATSELNSLLVSGGQGWQRYGIDLSDATVALHQLGSESATALTSQTEAVQADLRRKEALRQVTEQIRNAGDAQAKAADQADAQARANDRLGLALGKLFSGPGTGLSGVTTAITTGVAGAVEGSNLDSAINDIATQQLKARGYQYGGMKYPLIRPPDLVQEGMYGGMVGQPDWLTTLGIGESEAQRLQRERGEAARKEVQAQAQQILKEGNYTVNEKGVPTAVEAGGQRRVIAPEQGQQLLMSAQLSAAQRILTRPAGGVENPADPAMQQALDKAGVKIDENNGKVTAGKEAWRSVFDEISQGNETLKLGVQYSEQLVASAERLAGIIEQRPGGLLGLSDADISGVASYRAQVDALRASAANIATAGAEGGANVATDYLQAVVEAAKTNPTPQRQREAQAAQDVLDNPEKLAQYRQQEEGLESARRQQQRSDLQAGQAQYRQQLLQQQEQQRQLDRANELAKIRTTVLNLDSLAAPLQLQQTVVQDRLNVLARENLGIQQNLLLARQAQLATTERLSETDYRMRHNQAEAAVIQARIIRGEAGPADVERLNVLRADQFRLALRRPEEALADLETGRGVEVVQQQQTRDQLARQLASIPLQAQQYTLTDQLVAIKEARDAEQARADAINRSLELATAAQQPAKTLADQAVLEAQAVKARADDEERYWKARIAGVAYERTQPPEVTGAEARARELGWNVTPGATVPNPLAMRVPSAVPVGAGQTPIDLRGATINNVADIERIATQAAAEASAKAYTTVKTTLLQVFNNAQPDLPGTMSGVQR